MSEIGIPRNRVMASKYVRHDEHGMRNTIYLPLFNLWSITQRLTSPKTTIVYFDLCNRLISFFLKAIRSDIKL